MSTSTFVLPVSLALQLLTSASPSPQNTATAPSQEPAPKSPATSSVKATPPAVTKLTAAQQATAAKLVGPALAEGHAYARLAELTDGIGPRLSGSESAEAAVQWALRSFQADGVKAWKEPVKVPRWVRGEEHGEILASERTRGLPLALLALGGSAPTPPEGITAEVVEVSSLEELAALGDKVKGRIVFFNHTMSEAADYGRFAGLRGRGPAAAAKQGAVAALVRSLATASLRTPHTGSTRFDEGGPRLPAAAVSVEDALTLHRMLQGGAVKVRLVLGCSDLPDADSSNVVAEVRGREKPDEVVLLGAHLDSWDVGTGAHDDGAGVVMVMEAARLIAKLPQAPRRTVRVVLFMNEENGLRGGRAYAEAHAKELPKHVAAIEMDAGGGRPLGVSLHSGPGGEALMRPWLAPLEGLGAAQFLVGHATGADLSPMEPAHVPFVGVRVDSSRYFDVHHSMADTLDKVDPQDLSRSTAAVTWMAYALAESPGTLVRPTAPESDTPPPPKK
ncbi:MULTISPECIES: M20/M25/M40 family metallo-hydrolase [Corallococcus]|uniref:M20/M25/M40 family metallo-hydrolase n=1 Tax=Corallococcus TaxID=83461 RepID=UPI000EEC922D|nr:M20/M25/M40 family metallo-hydrolase [Corallococcus sp. AB038B]NPC72362.1 M20/M25/M40 family metallo-hydrolase [Corallococcus exiguus]NPD28082.1 M20/M25/M40 family metallo-hydrolase [Corallococcus exiguus]NRD45084.1 M20/M25/M40 family metallo-hydrolase [Corallococcus exiguus]RKH93185.1 M20/M25/M40 family metallo-hydrolase [Corallococcus sp. AB038B]